MLESQSNVREFNTKNGVLGKVILYGINDSTSGGDKLFFSKSYCGMTPDGILRPKSSGEEYRTFFSMMPEGNITEIKNYSYFFPAKWLTASRDGRWLAFSADFRKENKYNCDTLHSAFTLNEAVVLKLSD